MQQCKILILATSGYTTDLLHNSLAEQHEVITLLETPERKGTLIRRRIKRNGLFKTLGQLAFMALIRPLLSKARIFEIIKSKKLNFGFLPEERMKHISSVNDEIVISKIQEIEPDFIVINGTRIISSSILNQITVPVVNIHVGITPKYRGVHGGYWALYNGQSELFGVTLHYVNAGIDTGQIISQSVIEPDPKDNFNSYPILQYIEGIELLKAKIGSILKKEKGQDSKLVSESQLYYHPTFFQYLSKRISKGVK